MKEFHTSLCLPENAVAIGVKSSKFLSQSRSRLFFSLAIAFVFIFSTATIGFGQSTEPAQASISTVLADPVRSDWKSHHEYSAVITAVKVTTTQKLAETTLQGPEKIMYTGLDRLLTYIQSDLETHDDVAPLADRNYKKVITESHSDPALQNLPLADFNVLYDELVVKLHQ